MRVPVHALVVQHSTAVVDQGFAKKDFVADILQIRDDDSSLRDVPAAILVSLGRCMRYPYHRLSHQRQI